MPRLAEPCIVECNAWQRKNMRDWDSNPWSLDDNAEAKSARKSRDGLVRFTLPTGTCILPGTSGDSSASVKKRSPSPPDGPQRAFLGNLFLWGDNNPLSDLEAACCLLQGQSAKSDVSRMEKQRWQDVESCGDWTSAGATDGDDFASEALPEPARQRGLSSIMASRCRRARARSRTKSGPDELPPAPPPKISSIGVMKSFFTRVLTGVPCTLVELEELHAGQRVSAWYGLDSSLQRLYIRSETQGQSSFDAEVVSFLLREIVNVLPAKKAQKDSISEQVLSTLTDSELELAAVVQWTPQDGQIGDMRRILLVLNSAPEQAEFTDGLGMLSAFSDYLR